MARTNLDKYTEIEILRRVFDDRGFLSVIDEGKAIGKGLAPGCERVIVLGYRLPVGGSPGDISSLGVDPIPVPSSAISMEIDSTSANDAAADTGIQEIEVHGLDADYNEISETKETNGTTAVALDNKYIRINNFHSIRVGSGGRAAGTITIQSVGGAVVYSNIISTTNSSLQCHYTVPAGKVAYLEGWFPSGATVDTNTIIGLFLNATVNRENRTLLPGIFAIEDFFIAQAGGTYREFPIPLKYPEKCDIKISVEILYGAANAVAAAGFELCLENP